MTYIVSGGAFDSAHYNTITDVTNQYTQHLVRILQFLFDTLILRRKKVNIIGRL